MSRRNAVLLATLVVGGALPGVARADTLLETITVPAENISPPKTSATTLTAGRSYKFVARGTFLIQKVSGDYKHDAIYCYGSTNGSLCNPPEEFGEKLTVGYENAGLNGFPAQFGTAPAYNAGHSYAVTFTAPETGRVRFFVGNPDGNGASGTLTVQIYKVDDTSGGGGGPTACTSALAKECPTAPWFHPVKHPQKSKSRKKWNAAEVTFNLAAGDYADATSPPLLSDRQKRAILDIRGVDDKDIAAFADSKFRRWGRAACVAVAGRHANIVMDDINRGRWSDPALARSVTRWAAAVQLETCLEMLDRALVAEQEAKGGGRAVAGAAASSCTSRVSIETARSGSKLVTTFRKKSAPSVLKVSCKRIRGGIRVTVKPRKKGASLKSVVGTRLHVGLMRSFTARTGNKDLGVKFKR